MATKTRAKVFIVDDHKIFREGLALLLNRSDDLELCGEAEDVNSALKSIRQAEPDIILLDISLKESSGLELIRDLQKVSPSIPVLVLSMHDEVFYADRAIKAGARGYIMKQESSEILMSAIQKVLGGKIYLSENMTDRALDMYSDTGRRNAASPVENLSNRELQVLELIGRGYTTCQIAKETNLNVKTIGTYREKIKLKLNLKSAAELTKYAIHWVESQ